MNFFTTRLKYRTSPISERIPKHKIQLLSQPNEKIKSRKEEQLLSLKRDRSLFANLYIACQARETDQEDFFKHENQPYPPSLSKFGQFKEGKKSDLIHCLESQVAIDEDSAQVPHDNDMIILDGAAIVHRIKPGSIDTFGDYAAKFIDYIREKCKGSVRRVDIMFDVYTSGSLKASTRSKRGKGTRRRVAEDKKIPSNWTDFLHDNHNKSQLFAMIGNRVHREIFRGQVVITSGSSVICSLDTDMANLAPCMHEEADTRIFIHAADGISNGLQHIVIRTVDTDVLVLAISYYNRLDCQDLWVAFGTGKSFRYINAKIIAQSLGPKKCKALPVFHAFSGCDTTSSFLGKGKRTAWATWNSFCAVTGAFCNIGQAPTHDTIREALPMLERFVIIMYDRGSTERDVNKARQIIFTQKARDIENIPLTQDALMQHTLRVSYQAGHIWGQCLLKDPPLPYPINFSWTWSESKKRVESYVDVTAPNRHYLPCSFEVWVH